MKSGIYHAIYAVIIVSLLSATIYFWQRTEQLSNSLSMIQKRIDQTKKELNIERAKRRKAEEIISREAVKKIDTAVPTNPKVAIVLDDWGYSTKNLQAALDLGCPVTFSILPNLPYSATIAEAAYRDGDEVMLHLPLEPNEAAVLEKDTITTAMSPRDVAKILDKDIASLPHLSGISNHMGSKATEDERTMSVIIKRMKKKRLYFFDSLVTHKSLGRDICGRLGVKFAARSVFLDNELTAAHVRKQIADLAQKANQTGFATGVGHDRAVTIAALKEMIPRLQEMGIEIVPASDIAR